MGLDELRIGARFLRRLPGFLRHPLGPDEARELLRCRLATRETDFLALVRRGVYDHPASPYRALLRHAGCEYGDLERLTRSDGVEGALRELHRRGVYVTMEEFKGRRPVVRGTLRSTTEPGQFRNPLSGFHVPVQSSGSRGDGGTPVLVDLDFIRDLAVDRCLVLEGRGGLSWSHAYWGVPGGTTLGQLLKFSHAGAHPERWFTQVDPAAPGLHPRYRWSTRALRWGGVIARVPWPAPELAMLEDPLPIARWMIAVRRRGSTPHLHGFTSAIVRLCHAALAAGLDLEGVQLTLGSEPTTAARLAVVRLAGATGVPNYGTAECGHVGHGCLAPAAADDLHLFDDILAVVQPESETLTRSVAAPLLMTSLRPTAPFILLNVSLGDRAVMERRTCGCPLERAGWLTHLHTVRSQERLTAGGMALLDEDVVNVLEEVLPLRFGGGPTHYQIVEEDTPAGESRLRLLVDPTVGPLDARAVAEAFLEAIGSGSGTERVASLAWRDAGLLVVERRAPYATENGKILHVRHRAVSAGSPDP